MQAIRVVCAVIVKNGQLLICKRGAQSSNAGMWEFPGGKIHPDESEQEAVVRECYEELRVNVQAGEIMKPVRYNYSHIFIELIPVFCNILSGEIQLTEHDEFAFCEPQMLKNYNLSLADHKLLQENDYFSALLLGLDKT